MGLTLDVATGHLGYAPGFAVMPLSFDLLYCRHGKTTGNTEPRVYQGFVDEAQNALNEIGLQQAEDAADAMDALDLSPSLVVPNPTRTLTLALARAQARARARGRGRARTRTRTRTLGALAALASRRDRSRVHAAAPRACGGDGGVGGDRGDALRRVG